VNEHPFSPRPENYDTVWWRGRDGSLQLEWRTPRQEDAKVYIYGGGAIELRAVGESLVGHTVTYRDVGPNRQFAVSLERLAHCR
jgi:hypothetical protein